jgi:hypothetical protein
MDRVGSSDFERLKLELSTAYVELVKYQQIEADAHRSVVLLQHQIEQLKTELRRERYGQNQRS